MNTLDRELRRKLDKTVREARRVAEAGAGKVLEQFAVGRHEPYAGMGPEMRELRNRLRAHARQLGDRRDPTRGTQAIDRLLREYAYEHWHRMLFARFLAESDLLIEPESGMPISLEECRELAREEGVDWLTLASDYAERMLPQIFRKDSPVLAIALPPETRSHLEELLKDLPRDVFTAEDSLGWVYQFWQADQKDAVNRSGEKIGADELPAVTQLFTEDYMVLFLLHNTLGAWWAGKVLADDPDLAASAGTEDELRAACAVGGVKWSYLRFVREAAEDGSEGPWRPASGTFEGWPRATMEITVLDPCMGSGHFLVFALPILVALRMAEEELSRETAVEAVLRDNLFGLEIDPRCTEIAAFNLAFAAWKMAGHCSLPPLNLACSGLAIGVGKVEWLRLAEKAAAAADPDAKRDLFGAEGTLLTAGVEERVKNGLAALHELFAKAPWLGSLIEPRRVGGDIFREGFDRTGAVAGRDPPRCRHGRDTRDGRRRTWHGSGSGPAGTAVHAGRHERALPRAGQAAQDDAGSLGDVFQRCAVGSGDRHAPPLGRLRGPERHNRRRHATELAVPPVLRQAAQVPVAGNDAERRCSPRTARVRDHRRRSSSSHTPLSDERPQRQLQILCN